MNNRNIITKLVHALDIKETDMVEIFKIGGVELSKDEVAEKFMNNQNPPSEGTNSDNHIECSNNELICFLNGFIIFKRGKEDSKPDQPAKDKFAIANNMNNILLKKLKIALSLTSEEMLSIYECVEVILTKRELGAIFRTEGHKNYKNCSDKLAEDFLNGLAIKYQK